MAPINIQSQDYRDLLDIIDSLRSQGLDRYVALPEIIVCGDQSSGKSSVLEAISGLSFPTKDSLCTRFPTELILRRHPEASVVVTIKPHHSRSDSEKEKLLAFTATLDAENPDVGPVIEAAKVAMGLVDGDVSSDGGSGGSSGNANRRFSSDVLRIELSGPKQQHLTLVDLPGLFLAGNSTQSVDEAPVVRQIVTDYMTRPRSIILAVVSAAYEFANQIVTQLSREVDPHGARTLGLITKPDKLEDGTDSERAFVNMACNRDVHLQLGWHVLKNRDHKMQAATSAERDASEIAFFTKAGSVWHAVAPANLGIGPLRPRLSTVLMDQILSQLPAILVEVDSLLAECTAGLERLGAPRATVLEQRQYLSKISSEFSRLMTDAVNGSYTDTAFFGTILQRKNVVGKDGDTQEPSPNDDKSYQRRLRAVVQNRLTQFAKNMHLRGSTRLIMEDTTTDETIEKYKGRAIRRHDFTDEVKNIISMSRGRELPGTFNPLVVSDLFRDQCRNWGSLAEQCTESILQSSSTSIAATLEHITASETGRMILKRHINPAMAAFKGEMHNETNRLTAINTKWHPVTYNHYLTETVQAVRNARSKERLRMALNSAANRGQVTGTVDWILSYAMTATEPDMERVAASDAIDYMEAYYKV